MVQLHVIRTLKCRLGPKEKFQEVIKQATIEQKVANILIDCQTENIIPILHAAKKVNPTVMSDTSLSLGPWVTPGNPIHLCHRYPWKLQSHPNDGSRLIWKSRNGSFESIFAKEKHVCQAKFNFGFSRHPDRCTLHVPSWEYSTKILYTFYSNTRYHAWLCMYPLYVEHLHRRFLKSFDSPRNTKCFSSV